MDIKKLGLQIGNAEKGVSDARFSSDTLNFHQAMAHTALQSFNVFQNLLNLVYLIPFSSLQTIHA